MPTELPSDLSEMKIELIEKIQASRDYAATQAEKARNQAIGALAFAAMVIGLAAYLLIDQTVERQIESLGGEKILEDASSAAAEAEGFSTAAKASASEIETIKTKYAQELSELTQTRTDLSQVTQTTSDLQKNLSLWGKCSWRNIGPGRAHTGEPSFCAEGEFLASFDLDSGGGEADSPWVGRAYCCSLKTN